MRRLYLVRLEFDRSESGSAVIEFALVVPVLILLYVGLVAVSMGIATDRKLDLVARTVADLAGQAVAMDCTQLRDTVGASTAVLAPYDPTGMSVAVASVFVTDTGAKVTWSQARNITSASGQQTAGTVPSGWAAGASVNPIPTGFAKPWTSFVMSSVVKGYTPVVGASLTGTISLTHSFNWPTRNVVQQIPWQGTTSCP